MAMYLPFAAARLQRAASIRLDADAYEKDMVNVEGTKDIPGFGKAYTVEIDRGEKMQKLGMCMYQGLPELTGIITEVEPDSLVAGTVVQKFDRLIALNGKCTSDLDRVFKALKTSRHLTLFVKRPKVYAIKVAKDSGLGLSFGYASAADQFLVIEKINRGVIQSLNKQYKDREVRKYDAIVSVNGITGTSDNLIAEIESSDQVTLGMMRWFSKIELTDLGLDAPWENQHASTRPLPTGK